MLVLAVYIIRNKLPSCIELARLMDKALTMQQGNQEDKPASGIGSDERRRRHAILLWGLQQRINTLRVELGMPQVVDLPSEK